LIAKTTLEISKDNFKQDFKEFHDYICEIVRNIKYSFKYFYEGNSDIGISKNKLPEDILNWFKDEFSLIWFNRYDSYDEFAKYFKNVNFEKINYNINMIFNNNFSKNTHRKKQVREHVLLPLLGIIKIYCHLYQTLLTSKVCVIEGSMMMPNIKHLRAV